LGLGVILAFLGLEEVIGAFYSVKVYYCGLKGVRRRQGTYGIVNRVILFVI